MYCPNCGTYNAAPAELCVICKKALPKPESIPTPPPANEIPGYPSPAAPPRPDFQPGLPGSQYSYAPPSPMSYPGYGYPAQVSYAPGYGYSYPVDRIGVARHDAGFWVRFGASLIDTIIVGLLAAVVAGIPQVIYWTNFATRYGNELGVACPSRAYYQDSNQVDVCNNTLTSIFLDRNELGGLLAISIGFGMLAAVLALVYYVGMTARGATIGKRVFGLKVVREDGTPPGFGRALLRQTLGYWLSGAVFYLGFIWIAFDDHKQGWHDKIAQTYVVRA